MNPWPKIICTYNSDTLINSQERSWSVVNISCASGTLLFGSVFLLFHFRNIVRQSSTHHRDSQFVSWTNTIKKSPTIPVATSGFTKVLGSNSLRPHSHDQIVGRNFLPKFPAVEMQTHFWPKKIKNIQKSTEGPQVWLC